MERVEKSSSESATFEELFRAHHQQILAYCARRASHSEAWDAASEVFVVAWRRLSEIPPPPADRAWLIGVAYRVLANQRRAARRRLQLAQKISGAEPKDGFGADEPLIRREEEREVVAALERLRPSDRELLLLTLWEELPRSEIATVLGISSAALDKRFSRARRRLGRELEQSSSTWGRATPTSSWKGGAS